MYATGASKFRKEGTISRQDRAAQKEQHKMEKEAQREEEEELDESEAGAATPESDEEREALFTDPQDQDDPKKALRSLMIRATRILDSKRELSGKRRVELREYSRLVKKTLSKLRGIDEDKVEDTVEGLESGLAEILSKIPEDNLPKDEAAALDTAEAAKEQDKAIERSQRSSNPQMQNPDKVDNIRARKDAELLHAALERLKENPIDESKPYATPWKPREFMSAFAFIPRYLEVNQNICSAVYLRHPVARPGLAEVPTPFHGETMGLAFNWYLRRR